MLNIKFRLIFFILTHSYIYNLGIAWLLSSRSYGCHCNSKRYRKIA